MAAAAVEWDPLLLLLPLPPLPPLLLLLPLSKRFRLISSSSPAERERGRPKKNILLYLQGFFDYLSDLFFVY